MALTGGCHCGRVRYEITGKVGPIVHCHCSDCRRSQGGAFATNATVRDAYFHLISGEAEIAEYESSPGKLRCFCRQCGSALWSRLPDTPDTTRIRLGTLDGDPGRRPIAHCFVGQKAS